MITATITGGITSALAPTPEGEWYCTVYSNEARRSVRIIVRNEIHAALIRQLPKHGRLSVTGQLRSKGAISPTGKTLAHLTIILQTMKIHEVTHD